MSLSGWMDVGRRWRVGAAAVAVVTALLVFVLPFFVPVQPLAAVSASYLAGFDNTAAAAGAVLVSVGVLAVRWRMRRRPVAALSAADAAPMGWRFVLGMAGFSGTVLLLCGVVVMRAHLRNFGDAGYIIEQASAWHETGRRLYTQLEFAYGPGLLLPEVWLSELLHCRMEVAYYITLAVESGAGVVMLAYLLDAVPAPVALRRETLLVLVLAGFTPHLGLNYTYFRFAGPLAVLLYGVRRRTAWGCAAALTAGAVAELLVSPELGLAMAGGVAVWGALRGWQSGWRWMVAAAVPLAGMAGFLLIAGRTYLQTLAMFAGGVLNLPVGPYPHIVVLLAAMCWVVPVGLAERLRLREAESAQWLALYAVTLAMTKAALGRCDPLHVVFDGVGMWVLALLAVGRRSGNVRMAWMLCLVALVVWDARANLVVSEVRTAETLRRTLHPGANADYLLNMPELRAITGGQPVATPLEITPVVEAQLKAAGQYRPEYYAFWMDMMSAAGEQRSIAEVNGFGWMLLPSGFRPWGVQRPEDAWFFQGMRLPLRTRRQPLYSPGEAFGQNLRREWTAVRTMGPYTLYRRNGM